jgi:hypothetical protein
VVAWHIINTDRFVLCGRICITQTSTQTIIQPVDLENTWTLLGCLRAIQLTFCLLLVIPPVQLQQSLTVVDLSKGIAFDVDPEWASNSSPSSFLPSYVDSGSFYSPSVVDSLCQPTVSYSPPLEWWSIEPEFFPETINHTSPNIEPEQGNFFFSFSQMESQGQSALDSLFPVEKAKSSAMSPAMSLQSTRGTGPQFQNHTDDKAITEECVNPHRYKLLH